MASDVAEVEKGAETPDHFIRDKTHNGGEVDFHQGLGIIASPLFETSTLFESAEAWEQGCSSNSAQPMSDPDEVKGHLSRSTYRRSISSKILSAPVQPCSSSKYSPAHVTR